MDDILLKCEAARSDLMALRAMFRQDINKLIGDVPWKTDSLEQVIDLLHDQRLTERVAKCIFVVLEVFQQCTDVHTSTLYILTFD